MKKHKWKLAFWGVGAIGVTASVILGNVLAQHLENEIVGDFISIFLILCLGGAYWGASSDIWIWRDDDPDRPVPPAT